MYRPRYFRSSSFPRRLSYSPSLVYKIRRDLGKVIRAFEYTQHSPHVVIDEYEFNEKVKHEFWKSVARRVEGLRDDFYRFEDYRFESPTNMRILNNIYNKLNIINYIFNEYDWSITRRDDTDMFSHHINVSRSLFWELERNMSMWLGNADPTHRYKENTRLYWREVDSISRDHELREIAFVTEDPRDLEEY